MVLFDTHAHLDDEKFAEDFEDVLARLKQVGVSYVLNAAFDLDSSENARKLALKYDFIYAMAGVHPHEAADVPEDYIERLSIALDQPKVLVLGEIGLDYHYDISPREVQKKVFCEQIELAIGKNKPMSFHLREAWGDAMDILRRYKAQLPPSILHCFSGSWETAKECLDMGMMISFAGPLTFKNADRLREVASRVPMDRLLVETDCPYMAPVPFRGKRNEPSFVVETAAVLAEVKGVSPDAMAEQTTQNALRFLGLQN